MFQNKAQEVKLKKVELKAQQITRPYLNKQTLKSDFWNLAGDIVVRNGQHISLTSDLKHQASNMFTKEPIPAASFEMELTFHIHGKGTLQADGLAIWFLKEPSPIGDVFGARNNFEGLGIMIDTFRNGPDGNFPYISAHGGQGMYYFDKYSDGMRTKRAGCTAKSLLNPASGLTRLRIIHTKDGYLSLDLNYNPVEANQWHNCFTLTDVILPEKPYLGLSAETGELTQNVDIIESKLFGVYLPEDGDSIHNVGELEHLMEEQKPVFKGNRGKKGKKVRKSLLRLRKAEERIKERERAYRLERYGDPDATFVRRWVKRIRAFFTYLACLILVLCMIWVTFRIYKHKKGRGYKRSGLLD